MASEAYNNKRNALLYGIALAIVATSVGIYSASADSFDGDNANRPHIENHEEIRSAVEAGDFTTWASLLADHPKAEEFVNEDTFKVLQEANALRESGDREAARELLKENDIRLPRGRRFGHEKGEEGKREGLTEEEREARHAEMEERHEAIEAALESGDYNAWAELSADHPHFEEFVNEETFAVLQQAHELHEEDDHEGARELLRENEIRLPRVRRRGNRSRQLQAQ